MKIICIGWNYRPHLKELNGPLPEVPLIFLKPSTCIIHDGDDIVIPKGITNVQYECELALVLGKGGKDISEEDALALATRYDFSGGNIENIARKAAVGYVLSGEKASLAELLKYCDEETLSTAKDARRIGFGAE